MSDLQHFSKLAIALRPWRQQVVYIGGWAFRLYQYEPRAAVPEFDPIFTQDADVAYEVRAPLAEVGDIGNALQEAGFQELVNLGDARPPVTRYTACRQPPCGSVRLPGSSRSDVSTSEVGRCASSSAGVAAAGGAAAAGGVAAARPAVAWAGSDGGAACSSPAAS